MRQLPYANANAYAYAYAGSPILSFSEVDVSHGAVLLLRGPSGCGKSTWLALMAALVAATSGELMLGGWAPCSRCSKTWAWLFRLAGYRAGNCPHHGATPVVSTNDASAAAFIFSSVNGQIDLHPLQLLRWQLPFLWQLKPRGEPGTTLPATAPWLWRMERKPST